LYFIIEDKKQSASSATVLLMVKLKLAVRPLLHQGIQLLYATIKHAQLRTKKKNMNQISI
jgi:hypothetical protein